MKAQRQSQILKEDSSVKQSDHVSLQRNSSVRSSLQRHYNSMRCSISSRYSSFSSIEPQSNSSIIDAIKHQNMREVQGFLKHNADVDQIIQGKSVLVHAIEAGSAAIVRVLLQKGVSALRESTDGSTPLSSACDYHLDKIIKMLIDACVSSNTLFKHQQYDSPLHYASSNYKAGLVKWLIKHGADINSQFRGNINALQNAKDSHDTQLTQWLVKNGARDTS